MEILLDDTHPVFDSVTELQNMQQLGYPVPQNIAFNCLMNPLGPAPARGWFCLRRKTLNDIDLNTNHSITFKDDAGRKVTANYLIFSREPYNLTPGKPGDENAIFLCEMSDYRHLLTDPFLGYSINKQYNVRLPHYGGASDETVYHAGSLNSSTIWTWQTMLTNLWSNVTGIIGSNSTLPYSPDETPEGWKFPGVNVWTAISQVLHKIGCAVKWDPEDNSDQFSIVRIGATDAALTTTMANLATQNRLIFDREYLPIVLGRVPATVRSHLHTRWNHYGTEPTTIRTTDQWLNNCLHVVDTASGISGAALTRATVWEDLPAKINEDDMVDNSSACNTRGASSKTTLVNMAYTGGTRLHKIYSGIASIAPGSMLKGVAWRQDLHGLGDLEPGGLVTEIVRHPYYVAPNSRGDWDELTEWFKSSTENRQPDFSPTYTGLYTPYLQVAQVSGSPNENGYYTATIERFNPVDRTWSSQEAILVRDVNT